MSTGMAVLCVVNDMFKDILKKKCSWILLLDLSKCFNTGSQYSL